MGKPKTPFTFLSRLGFNKITASNCVRRCLGITQEDNQIYLSEYNNDRRGIVVLFKGHRSESNRKLAMDPQGLLLPLPRNYTFLRKLNGFPNTRIYSDMPRLTSQGI